MSRNPYTKTVKLFSKAESLFITRHDDDIYITEGHIIVKMHIAAYNAFFRPTSGIFIELENNETAIKNNTMAIAEKNNGGFNVYKAFEETKKYEYECQKVHSSPFLMEYSTGGKKNQLQRMLTGSNYYVNINNDFYMVSEEIGFNEFYNKGNSISPVWNEAGNNGILILPIRADQQTIDNFVNIGRVK